MPSQHTSAGNDQMDLDDEPDQQDTNESPQPAQVCGWWESINIPPRDLRYPSATLPPLGKIINASQNQYEQPLPPDIDHDEEYGDEGVIPGEPIDVELHKIMSLDDDVDYYATRADVQDLHQAIRDDLHAEFDRMLEEIDRRQQPETPEIIPATIHRRKKISKNPVRREASKNERVKSIRKHLAGLLGEKRVFSPRVTHEEAVSFKNLWEATQGNPPHHCCTVEDFRIDILGTPKNPWNRSAAHVFYKSFVPEANRSSKMFDQVTTDFHNHVKTIIAEYRKRTDDVRRRNARRDARRKARKYDLFHRRLLAAQTIPGLGKHIEMLQRLTIAGMSSDESDTEQIAGNPELARQTPRYEVTKPVWRHKRLSAWLHVFDTLHIAGRRSDGASAGEWPHVRNFNTRNPKPSSNTGFVADLPIDAYDEVWLNSRYDVEYMVRPVEDLYDFTHSDEIHAIG